MRCVHAKREEGVYPRTPVPVNAVPVTYMLLPISSLDLED